MTATSSSSARGGDNRARLLQLGAALFASQGYAQVSVRDLAARLGVSTGAIYSNFPSKGDLLAEILEVRVREDHSVVLPHATRWNQPAPVPDDPSLW
jgi:AcrR family transcriptional regulator